MDSSRHRCMGILWYCVGCIGTRNHCSGMMTLYYCMGSSNGPWEAHSKAPWGLQSHVVRCFEAFAFPHPSALFLCAPSASLNRYRLFVVVRHPVQGHLSSSY